MKNNDFDFIKQKFDNSGVNAPENMGADFAAKALEGVEPLRVEKKKSRRGVIIGISSAAAVAVITAGAILTSSVLGIFRGGDTVISNPAQTQTAVSASIQSFSSRDQIVEALRNAHKVSSAVNSYSSYDSDEDKGFFGKIIDRALSFLPFLKGAGSAADDFSEGEDFNYYSRNYSAEAGLLTGGSGSSGSSTHNSTYVQHTGVDEADTVKTDGRYIYSLVSAGDKIEIFSAQGKDSKFEGSIPADTDDYDNTEYNYSDKYFNDFYINGNTLVAMLNHMVYLDGDRVASPDEVQRVFDTGDFDSLKQVEMTDVNLYDISDINSVRLIDSFSQSGRYVSSRMIGSTLYAVSNRYSSSAQDIPFTADLSTGGEASFNEATFDELPSDCVFSVENPTSPSFLIVSEIDTKTSAQSVRTQAILGTADTVYCNLNNMYVTACQYTSVFYGSLLNNTYEGARGMYSFVDSQTDTQIIKISLENGMRFTATASVDGRIDNQYSLDEYNGKLRVATTSTDEDGVDVNNLFVLDENLIQLGEVTGFAENESIKAVRYIDDTAYVITYEQTDPLFVIDVSNPSRPEIKGEVKIDGFSTLLVPIDKNTLLGIGYHTEESADDDIDMEIQEGLKLVVFDVSDKSNPKVLDQKIFRNYFSSVQNNPKALLVNNGRGDFTVPFTFSEYTGVNYEDYKAYSGIINFRVNGGKLEIIDEYVSDAFKYNEDCIDLERCVYVDNNIYMLGENYARYSYINYVSEDRECSTVIDSVQYK